MWGFDYRQSRPVTSELLDLAEQGVLSWEQLARDALGWMSEAEVQQFAQANDYLQEQEDE
jgi:aldehyde:ferredoxin oxidoreductase